MSWDIYNSANAGVQEPPGREGPGGHTAYRSQYRRPHYPNFTSLPYEGVQEPAREEAAGRLELSGTQVFEP